MIKTLLNNISVLWRKSFWFKLAFCLVVILISISSIFFLLSLRKSTSPGSPPQDLDKDFPRIATTRIKEAPAVWFESYENQAALPTLPESINTYTFEIDYSLEDVLNLGKKLGLETNTYKESENFIILYGFDKHETTKISTLLVFDRSTGHFFFQSIGNHQLSDIASSINDSVQKYLLELKVIDETVSCPVVYQKRVTGALTTFVECHRDWSKAGLPIFNLAGLLNVPEELSLSNLLPGQIVDFTPTDPVVTNAASGEEGKIRPNDFNTMTVALSSDRRIIGINSNLRQISSVQKINTASNLLSPPQALSSFLSHKEQFSLVIPTGQGKIDWDKIYTNNLAQAQKAVITDYTLSYLEKPAWLAQVNLVPMYTIRGIAQLDSGYSVRFVQTLPALKNNLSFAEPKTADSVLAQDTTLVATAWFAYQEELCNYGPWFGNWQSQYPNQVYPGSSEVEFDQFIKQYYQTRGISVLAARRADRPLTELTCLSCGCPSNIQLQILIAQDDWGRATVLGFNPTEEATPTIPPATIPTTEESPTTPSPCKPSEEDLDPIYDLGELGKVGVYDRWIYGGTTHFFAYYYIPPKDKPLPKLSAILAEIEKLGLADWQSRPELGDDWRYYLGHCPIQMTGNSPTLFIYTKPQLELKIKAGKKITYANPPTEENDTWRVTTEERGQLKVNNFYQRNYLYYEYEPVLFTRPQSGWIIDKRHLVAFIRDRLTPSLGLLPLEEERLIFEFDLVGRELSTEQFFVGLIDPKEIAAKVPLLISPKPDAVVRLHFYLAPVSSNESLSLSPPDLSLYKIPPRDFMVLELGAVKGE